jgi:hypothetical protein
MKDLEVQVRTSGVGLSEPPRAMTFEAFPRFLP